MNVGNKPTSGPRLWDIRFKGDRIVYELSMQEEMAGGRTAAYVLQSSLEQTMEGW
jgi:hypothetical protein